MANTCAATDAMPTAEVEARDGAAAADLAAALRARVRGEVRFDDGSRALYATDASNYRQVPIGVVVPRDADDVVAAVAVCRRFGAPILGRGCGTSLAGQCCNAAVVLDMSKYMHRVLEIDPARKIARVEPGCILDTLRAAAEAHHLTFGPDPATHDHCTLGGMIGNNSCGVHSVMAGKTVDNVESLEILTYDGLRLRVGALDDDGLQQAIRAGGRPAAIYARLRDLRDRYADEIRARFPDIPRRVSGYNLDQLLPEAGFHVARALVGTESTCVIVLEATLRLVDSPPVRSLAVLGYPDVYAACDAVPAILEHGPIGLEGFDHRLVEDMQKKQLHVDDLVLLPDGQAWLLVEFGGATRDEADGKARALQDALRQAAPAPAVCLYADPAQQQRVWQVRESALGATDAVPGKPNAWPGWEDSAVPPAKLSAYLRDLRALLDRYGYEGDFYGHFGQGCVHLRIDFDFVTAAGIAHYAAFIDEAADLVVRYGGSLSGEHGDGQARGALLPKMYGPDLVRAFGEFKAIWDPDNHMNPGKVVHPYAPTENLRLGPDYNPRPVTTFFQYPADEHSFAHATLRCVGVGKCRRLGGGTMCPSFMVTREEKHSTRGRARLLFEMLEGGPLTDGWRSEPVREALDLCLACKGCKGDCPVDVDMATYKSEFLAHYYAGRLRPRTAYTMGLIYWWARLAARAPGVVNFVTHAPLLAPLMKAAGGIAPQRRLPVFAPQTFQAWFQRRPRKPAGGRRVILWPDTFNNHFHPETARAAVEVLEAAGCEVIVPRQSLCCGRPLYDWGMLGLARGLLRQVLDTLRDEIRAGTPVVGLEPSCVAVFRDELTNLFPDDEDAKRLRGQAFLLSEFLTGLDGYTPPHLARAAVVHGHCHHKAIMTMRDETRVLDAMGLDYRVLDSGCCGMAGAFGFERGEHYDVSIKAGERVLLPAVRQAAPDALIIADGFSCREQIAQTTDRRALHLAEVLHLALRDGSGAPDATDDDVVAGGGSAGRVLAGAALAAAVLAGGALWRRVWPRR